MKKRTKCSISRLRNLGVGLFVDQQVNSDSQIVFKRQNILVCAQNVNEGKKWILSSFLPFKDLKTPALWSMQNNVEKDRDSPPPTIRLLNYANQWSALGRWIIVSNIGGRFCELYKEDKVKNTFEVNLLPGIDAFTFPLSDDNCSLEYLIFCVFRRGLYICFGWLPDAKL